uniref:ATP synthase F0 subunit 8 n=1 Tax=Myrophis microchir TaxID=1368085 RepID=UPI0028FCE67D|nr:ATP synthase F0 subunit 8 [Myrophis microchir]WNH38033.1 ATP synthase F0 subunit 8 [Myrophis microchir]
MPQLKFILWFKILIYSWIMFLVFIPPKVTAFVYSFLPNPKTTKKTKKGPWTWPWH